ncbi:hypothetical protein [Bradyrhizobium oligotrophicum]|uniref:hypothetical protein n=1 Tax=Bradyrhizobium oligotrophicum TaxID=44255 RepID=UPI003EBEDD93
MTERKKSPPKNHLMKSLRKEPHSKTLRRRHLKYQAAGKSCPEGHDWKTFARYNYRGYRFCAVCQEAKALQRKEDPSTFVGQCPKGHFYTRDNTVITNWNTKVCLACKRARLALENAGTREPRRAIPTAQTIQSILARARAGATMNSLCGRASFTGETAKVTNRPQLLWIINNSPVGTEIKTLLTRNATASHGRKRNSLIGVVRTTNIARPALIMPADTFLAHVRALLPRGLPRDQRDDIVGEIALAVLEGRISETDLAKQLRKFVSASYQADHNKYGPLSLDLPAFREGDTTLIEMISEGLWS